MDIETLFYIFYFLISIQFIKFYLNNIFKITDIIKNYRALVSKAR